MYQSSDPRFISTHPQRFLNASEGRNPSKDEKLREAKSVSLSCLQKGGSRHFQIPRTDNLQGISGVKRTGLFPSPSLLQAAVQGEGGDQGRDWEVEEKWKKLKEKGAEGSPGASALGWTGVWNPPWSCTPSCSEQSARRPRAARTRCCRRGTTAAG